MRWKSQNLKSYWNFIVFLWNTETHYCPLRSSFDPINIYLLNYLSDKGVISTWDQAIKSDFPVVLVLFKNGNLIEYKTYLGFCGKTKKKWQMRELLVVISIGSYFRNLKKTGNMILYCNVFTLKLKTQVQGWLLLIKKKNTSYIWFKKACQVALYPDIDLCLPLQ